MTTTSVSDTAGDEPEVLQAEQAGSSPDPHAVLLALNEENASLKDRLTRMLAEMENLRRRTAREVEDARSYGVSAMARDMLTFADNLRRSLENLPGDMRALAAPAIQTFIKRIELTEQDFLSRLQRHGVVRMEPHGDKFDPNRHEALFEVHQPEAPHGSIASVVEAGYMIGERVLRPAKVGVARGGPKGAPGSGAADVDTGAAPQTAAP